MKHFIYLSFYIWILSSGLAMYAQASDTARISGRVIAHNKDNDRLFAISLLSLSDSTYTYTLADSNGYFHYSLLNIDSRYLLEISYPGFEPFDTTIYHSSGTLHLDEIYLYPIDNLEEVIVKGTKPLIEHTFDGLRYNVAADETNKGLQADEIIKKVPWVTTDADGNISLSGKGNIKVLIDGKPSSIIAPSVKEALKQIPADIILYIEVVTAPGAKHADSDGLINVITNKSKLEGILGNINGGSKFILIKNLPSYHGSGSINYKMGKFNIGLSFNAYQWRNANKSYTSRTDWDANGVMENMQQQSDNDNINQGGTAAINIAYEIDSLNSVWLAYNYGNGKTQSLNELLTQNDDRNISTLRDIDNISKWSNNNVNAGYTKIFKNNKNHTLDILTQFNFNKSPKEYLLYQFNQISNREDYIETNADRASHTENTLQIDYTFPLAKGRLELGGKIIDRQMNSDFTLLYGNELTLPQLVRDEQRSNQLKYNQKVLSSYAQTSHWLVENKWSVNAGFSVQQTWVDGLLIINKVPIQNEYLHLLPNASLSYNFNQTTNFRLGYSTSINRPSLALLNPYVHQSDPLNIQFGNPKLDAAKTHNLQLSYSAYKGAHNWGVSMAYYYTGNEMTLWRKVENGINQATYANNGINHILGWNTYTSIFLWNKWRIYVVGNSYYMNLSSKAPEMKNRGFQFYYSVYSNYKISKNNALEFFMRYTGNSVGLQSNTSGYYYYTFKYIRRFLNEKLQMVIEGENIFNTMGSNHTRFDFSQSVMQNEVQRYMRGFSISCSYTFGKMQVKNQKSIQNTDLK